MTRIVTTADIRQKWLDVVMQPRPLANMVYLHLIEMGRYPAYKLPTARYDPKATIQF
jgi:hypothetical protein